MTRFVGVRMGVALRKPILIEWHKEETGEKKGDSQAKTLPSGAVDRTFDEGGYRFMR